RGAARVAAELEVERRAIRLRLRVAEVVMDLHDDPRARADEGAVAGGEVAAERAGRPAAEELDRDDPCVAPARAAEARVALARIRSVPSVDERRVGGRQQVDRDVVHLA